MTLPLEGIRVLDWTIWQQGPAATTLLGDLGAEVIKIEEPLRGDPGRGLTIVSGITTVRGDWNLYFECFDRSKKSITIDLKREESREIINRLVKKTDVFITNLRLGVAERLGLDYESLCKYNPKIVYVQATAFGPEGEDAGRPGYDITFQARSGLMASLALPGEPPIDGPCGIADQTGSVMLACAALAGLLTRDRLGIGQKIDVSGLGSMIWAQQLPIGISAMREEVAPKKSRQDAENPLWNWYPCQAGKWIMLAMVQSDRYWSEFAKVLGGGNLATNPKFDSAATRAENHRELINILDEIFMTKPRNEWMTILTKEGDFIFAPINTVEDLFTDPQVLSNKYITTFEHPSHGTIKTVGTPMRFDKTPAEIRLPAPELGQHTEEVLLELGYSWDEVAKFKGEGII